MNSLPALALLFVCACAVPFAGCSGSSGGSSTETEAGLDAPGPDSLSTGDAPSCDADATATSCCCAGDQQRAPVCGADGTLSCTTGYGLYHGADCSCTNGHGPCCIGASTLDASDAADAPASDSDVCQPPQLLQYEAAGCGASAHPVCGSGVSEACANLMCGCDGTTIAGCGFARAPWAHLGACEGGEGGGDAQEQ